MGRVLVVMELQHWIAVRRIWGTVVLQVNVRLWKLPVD